MGQNTLDLIRSDLENAIKMLSFPAKELLRKALEAKAPDAPGVVYDTIPTLRGNLTPQQATTFINGLTPSTRSTLSELLLERKAKSGKSLNSGSGASIAHETRIELGLAVPTNPLT